MTQGSIDAAYPCGLCTELWLHIFSFLSPVETLKSAGTCTFFATYASEPKYWQRQVRLIAQDAFNLMPPATPWKKYYLSLRQLKTLNYSDFYIPSHGLKINQAVLHLNQLVVSHYKGSDPHPHPHPPPIYSRNLEDLHLPPLSWTPHQHSHIMTLYTNFLVLGHQDNEISSWSQQDNLWESHHTIKREKRKVEQGQPDINPRNHWIEHIAILSHFTILTISREGEWRLWDLEAQQTRFFLMRAGVKQIQLQNEGLYLSYGADVFLLPKSYLNWKWGSPHPEGPIIFHNQKAGHNHAITSFDLSYKRLFSASVPPNQQKPRFHSQPIEDQSLRIELNGHQDPISSIKSSSLFLFSLDEALNVGIWDPYAGTNLFMLSLKTLNLGTFVSILPFNNSLIIKGQNKISHL